ncbi:hypothetical protein AALO_G00312170 [Alosa alosa]|uniref:UMOD/GP2/OIT3-like D8C domain-containing protein n=1 Tax=Alosa alosa TaxID=278164 RepID=A0AAV6FGA2_9TELE|nr:hypothetical protein AALO_G00312170 [Alosa alosa]
MNQCCYIKPPSIQVKACPGNYTVYKLVDPDTIIFSCYIAYCADFSDKGALPTKSPDPSHVVGLLLKVSAVKTLNETEIEEQILKPFGETLRARGLDVTGIRLRRVHQTGP